MTNPYWNGYQWIYPRQTSGMAVASLVLGLVWFFWVGSVLAVVFGHLALAECQREGKQGQGMAVAGLVLGYIGVATMLFGIIGMAVM